MTLRPSSATATVLATINSMGVTTASISAPETDMKKGKQLHLEHIKQDQAAADLANLAPSSAIKKQSIVKETPDVGILSKDFLKNNRQEELSVDKKFTIHRKNKVDVDVDVDVGILSNGRRQQQQTPRANLHAMNEVLGRSLQSEERLPYMCPGKKGRHVSRYFDNLFDENSYFPKCSCPSPTTCGPNICECLEYADGDFLECMDPFNQLCEGTMYIEGIPGPWSMEECLGDPYGKFRAIYYCSWLPCFVDGGSYMQCKCELKEKFCTEYRDAYHCAMSKCCQAQTDDGGREACFYGDLHENYYDQVTSFSISDEEVISRFNECSFNADSDKSIVQCYCESFSYGYCVNFGIAYPDRCEAMNCCWEQTEDDARLDCFTTRFRTDLTGWDFYHNRDTIKESCIASGRSSDQCKCDIHGSSNCVFGIVEDYSREPRCDLFQCCQSQTDDNDEGRKDCLVQDETQLLYETCINNGNTTESCYCDKSTTLCTAGHSNGRHCELSSCCQEQTDDIGRKECIGNFTTSQPSSAPSETTPAEDTGDDGASSTAASTLPGTGTSSASIPNPFSSKSLVKTTSKMLAVTAAVIGWLLLS